MKLLKLTLHHFRQFYGDNHILFSTDRLRNITLIHGENGLGKTTILNAVLWCFYGTFTSDFENKNEIINLFSLSEGNNQAYVEVYFEHENKEYYIKREHVLGREEKSYVFELSGGSFNQKLSNHSVFIESVIPPKMAEYFFFHGEGIANIANEKNISNFRKAMRDILGCTSAEYAIEDLNILKKKRYNELQKITKKDSLYNQYLQDKISFESKKQDLLIKKEEVKDKIDTLINDTDYLNDQLAKIKTFNVSEIQSKRLNAIKLIKNNDNVIFTMTEKKKNLVKQYAIKLFGYSLSTKVKTLITEKEILGEIPSPYDESLVNKILDSKICLCGRPVVQMSEEYKIIQSLRNDANTSEIKTRKVVASAYAGAIGDISSKPEEFIENYSSYEAIINSNNIEAQRLKITLSDCDAKLEEIGDGGQNEVNIIRTKLKENETSRSILERKLSELDRNISTLILNIADCDRKIGANTPNNDLAFKLNNEIEIIQKLISRCEEKLEQHENTAKRNIASSVNLILENFSRKDFKVKVTNQFEFKLSRNDGILVAKSKGENLLLNLAFISALLGFCAKRSTADDKFLIKGTVAPFFIDAPFGELDETYRQATASFLPECCQQLILLLSSSHWKGTVDMAITNKIGKEYIIISHKIDNKNMKPDDIITIKSKNHHQSIYNSHFEGSTIEEI